MALETEKIIIVDTINRVYDKSLTTTSGGNLSMRDKDNNIYITPSGKDKGTLDYSDICKVTPDGTVIGKFKPSIELPFHSTIYRLRPDINAVLHVHSPYLVSYSLLNSAPDINVLPYMKTTLKKVGLSAYDIPGSIELGQQIAKYIADGYDAVMMQNHGVVLVADTMAKAYIMLETLENCAKLCLNARKLSNKTNTAVINATSSIFDDNTNNALPIDDNERNIRVKIAEFAERCYKHELFSVNNGVISVKLDDNSFLITPNDYDRNNLDPDSIVKVSNGVAYGGLPDELYKLHHEIYSKKLYVNSIFSASPVNIMAYGITDTVINSRTIPESYIMMRDLARLQCGAENDNGAVAAAITQSTPVVMIENSRVITTGETIVKAFDRLEVTDVTAKNLLLAHDLGIPMNISDEEIKKIDVAFNLPV